MVKVPFVVEAAVTKSDRNSSSSAVSAPPRVK
jgi:hypothetical protein